MSDVIEQARTSIKSRLRDLESEAARLRKALVGLDSGSMRTTARTGPGASQGRRARKARAGRGQRQAQFLEALQKNPCAKVQDIAKAIGVSPNQAYGLARRLHDAGQITKRRGGGYAAKA